MRKFAISKFKAFKQIPKPIACIMKLSVFLLLLSFQVYAEGSAQKVTLNFQNEKFGKILKSIEQQTSYRFVFSNHIVPVNKTLSIKAEQRIVQEVLKELLLNFSLDFREEGGNLIVIFQEAKRGEEQTTAPLADIEIRGKVSSAQGLALSGASIAVKGTNRGTSSDAEGNFSISVPNQSSVLLVSYVGHQTKEVRVGNSRNIEISLELSDATGNEIVVVGYGTQRRRDVTGAISKVNEEAFKLTPIASADQALQGRAAGVQVTQSSGAPGGAVQVRIRGVNTTAGNGANQPLYVVDGVPLFYNEGMNSLGIGNPGQSGGAASNASSPLSTISPNDIESIEVLKDASATAIYGARAANGVVLITTKTGRIGKPIIALNVNYGIQSLREKIPVTNAQERAALIYEHRRNAGTRGGENNDVFSVNPFTRGKGTDWQDEVFRSAPIANYNLSLSGGTDRITYNVSGDYFDQQGIVINTYSKRVGTRVNFDVKATDKLKIGTRSSLNYQWENGVANDDFFQGTLNYLTVASPLLPVLDVNGNYAGQPNTLIGFYGGGGDNAVANLMERVRKTDRYRIISNVYGEYSINSNFRLRSSFGVDYLFTDLRQVDPIWFRGVNNNGGPVRISENSNKTFNWIGEQTLNYDQRFGEHSISAVLGFSAQNVRLKTLAAGAFGSQNNRLDQLDNQTSPSGTNGGISEQGLVSQFFRTNYAYKGKYLLTGTVRRDGSSRFGGNNKYGWFPSGSIGWRISEEDFLKNNRSISELKLRASYGSTGSQEIGNFVYAALVNSSNNRTVFGDNYVNASSPTRFENRDIRWERTNALDVGIDLGLFGGRLNFTADYYRKTTDGLLSIAPLSVISGVGNAYQTNIGSIRNTGFEFAVNARIIDNKDFRLGFDFNISTNKNEVLNIGNLPFINGADVWRTGTFINRTVPGQPIGAFYILRTDGQYLNWADALAAPVYNTIGAQPYFAPGDFKLVDQNKDGKIDNDDREFYGSPFPNYFGGITANIGYKNFTFTAFAPFQHGNYVWNQPFLNASTFEGNVWRSIYDNRYLPSNPGVQTSIPVPRNNNPIGPSDLYLQDGSFLRIRTLTLGYDVPIKGLSFIKMSKIHLFAQANNLFVFTKYQGWDPEANSFGSNVISNGIDIGAYPQAKSFNVGANINF